MFTLNTLIVILIFLHILLKFNECHWMNMTAKYFIKISHQIGQHSKFKRKFSNLKNFILNSIISFVLFHWHLLFQSISPFWYNWTKFNCLFKWKIHLKKLLCLMILSSESNQFSIRSAIFLQIHFIQFFFVFTFYQLEISKLNVNCGYWFMYNKILNLMIESLML